MRKHHSLLLSLAVLILAIVAVVLMVANKSTPQRRQPEKRPPLVRVVEIRRQDHTHWIEARGTVQPQVVSQLVAEVPGRILHMAPSFRAGGRVQEGEVLLQLDSFDLQLAATQVEAELAAAELRLLRAQSEHRLALEEWREADQGKLDPLALHQPQLLEAEAAQLAAKARLEKARRDIERSTVRAPFSAMVRHALVDVGQFVGVGAPLGSLMGLDAAEIRLPLRPEDLPFLPGVLSLQASAPGPLVELCADWGGRRQVWQGRLQRLEAELDNASRMAHAVCVVADPFSARNGRPPLMAGMFVDARIQGPTLANAIVLPRSTLLPDQRILVLDEKDRIHFQQVSPMRFEGELMILADGPADGQRIVQSRLDMVTEGMAVRAMPATSNLEEP
jgi:RND family efflux transporter MFP subunit